LEADLTDWDAGGASLIPLHGFSPAISSLTLNLSSIRSSDILDLICSFPLLQNLTLIGHVKWNHDDVWNPPATSPILTGTLDFRLSRSAQLMCHQLLDLPSGLHFKRISLGWFRPEDVRSTENLVLRCSDILEFLVIGNYLPGALPFFFFPSHGRYSTLFCTQWKPNQIFLTCLERQNLRI
jgi:hypothetical protein